MVSVAVAVTDAEILVGGAESPGPRFPFASSVKRYTLDGQLGSVAYAYRGLRGRPVTDVAEAPDGDVLALTGDSLMRLTSEPGPSDADADGVTDDADACRLFRAPPPSGCPTLHRRIRFVAAQPQHRLALRFATRISVCDAREKVLLFERRAGPDRLVDRTQSTPSNGRTRFPKPDPGHYYALAPQHFEPKLGRCEAARTHTVQLGTASR